MRLRDAEAALEDVEVIPLFEAPLQEAKRIQERCLEIDVPALLGSDGHCKKGCAPRAQILVREQDALRVVTLLREEWADLALREGTITPQARSGSAGAAEGEGDPPCPACGCARPLVEGACADCGLVLA